MIKKIAIYFVVPLLGLFAVLYVFFLQPLSIPTGSDANEAGRLIQAIESKYHFRVMSRYDQRPAIYCTPGRKFTEIHVYGNYSRSEQDEICAVTLAVRQQSATKPIHLYFYPQELEQTGLMRQEIFK